MDKKQPRVMVAGGTGYIGGGVALALHNNGYWIRALTRDLKRKPEGCDEAFEGHATIPSTLKGLCDGIDVVFSSIGIKGFGAKPTFWDVDYQANINILEEAKSAGVKHFVFVTTLGGPKMALMCPLAEARERVASAVIESGMDYNIFAPAGLFNDMAHALAAARHGMVLLLGDGEGLLNPLSALDLGDEIAKAIKDPAQRNKVRSVGGPETMTHRNVAELCFKILGKKPRIKATPSWLTGFIAEAVKHFNDNAHALIKFFQFIELSDDLSGEQIGHRKLEDFLTHRARGLSDLEAEKAIL